MYALILIQYCCFIYTVYWTLIHILSIQLVFTVTDVSYRSTVRPTLSHYWLFYFPVYPPPPHPLLQHSDDGDVPILQHSFPARRAKLRGHGCQLPVREHVRYDTKLFSFTPSHNLGMSPYPPSSSLPCLGRNRGRGNFRFHGKWNYFPKSFLN